MFVFLVLMLCLFLCSGENQAFKSLYKVCDYQAIHMHRDSRIKEIVRTYLSENH